ncbi:TnpA transposase [Azospirillum argentinense]
MGELRDWTFENQSHRASGLNLMVAAIVLWNTLSALMRPHRILRPPVC